MVAVFSLCAALGWVLSASAAQTFRIATYNLRFDSRPDSITVNQSLASIPDPLADVAYYNTSGEQPWSLRRLYVAHQLLTEGTSLFGARAFLAVGI